MVFYLHNFFNYSTHIGHNKKFSLLLSSWFFYKLRKKIWIINIFKTIIFLKIVFNFIKYLVNCKLPLWFINLDEVKEIIFKQYAISCGEYFCTRIWVRGLISNFKGIQKSLSKYFLQKFIIKKEKKNMLIKNWSLTRFTWPRAIFLTNVQLNYIVCKEAGSVSLPIIAMVDTNIKSFLYNFPIPSNDDSIFSICYITSILVKKILILKYKKLLLWFSYYYNRRFLNIIKMLRKKNLSLIWSSRLNKSLLFLKIFKFGRSIKRFFKDGFFKFDDQYKLLNSKLAIWFNGFFKFYKRLSVLYCYFKKAIYKTKLKISKKYKFLILNFLKLKNLQKKLLNKNKKKVRNRKSHKKYTYLFKKFSFKYFSLNNFLINKIFNLTNYKSDVFYKRKFSELAILLDIHRWMSARQRYFLSRYLKRPILHYWLLPKIIKFSIRKNYNMKRRLWYHSMNYPAEKSFFKYRLRTLYYYRKKKLKEKPYFLQFYNNWFYFLLKYKY